ncbi:MAG: hypothetical protein A2V98_10010 [Planctomycetes bacterium RBG_16_64_12]|nr:MAG: hypothetical protein A2V98_10010 [Planctomycetes bacterium RBG_16_64_12]
MCILFVLSNPCDVGVLRVFDLDVTVLAPNIFNFGASVCKLPHHDNVRNNQCHNDHEQQER